MKIGILTFYKVANFGANLQAISTYRYLKRNGFTPIFINYMSRSMYISLEKNANTLNWKEHLRLVNEIITEQTKVCFSGEEILNVIQKNKIDAVIIGSDALLQHHPLISRIRMGKRNPLHIIKCDETRLFPNPFWGLGYSGTVPTAMMSVSSQNSPFFLFSNSLKRKMRNALFKMCYISVRDEWTKEMVESILPNSQIEVTPDPVFAFNYNAVDLIPSKKTTVQKFGISDKYILVSLYNMCVKEDVLVEIKNYYSAKNIQIILLPIPNGSPFNHPLDYEIKVPLSPLDWYALLKYSYAYIGSNMHPIVVCLHNGVRCYSIDNWGRANYFGHKKNDGSSKVMHILNVFGVGCNHKFVENFKCRVSPKEIIDSIESFPQEKVKEMSKEYYMRYEKMMSDIIGKLSNQM